jgi:hypothetical protein
MVLKLGINFVKIKHMYFLATNIDTIGGSDHQAKKKARQGKTFHSITVVVPSL